MFYLLHGDDEFTSREQLKGLRRQGDFAYNVDHYSGADVDLATIIATCDTMPFLSTQRLVVVEGMPRKRHAAREEGAAVPAGGGRARKGKKNAGSATRTRAGFEQGLAAHIAHLPESCVLIVLVDEELDGRNELLNMAVQHGRVILSTLPKGAAVRSWIAHRAQSLGASISPDAAALLADFIGNQLRLLANELAKLATYAGPGATITAADVRILSAQVQEARIFELTDAMAQRKSKQALDTLHELLADGEPPLKLLSTMTTQLRTLLLVKELSQQGMRAAQISASIGVAPFVAEKALRQVGRFTAAQLEIAYRQLLATDAALKRSRMTPEMALDLLVVNFANE